MIAVPQWHTPKKKWRTLKTKWHALKKPRALKIITLIYIAYLLLIGVVALPALNILAPKIYQQQTGRVLQLGKIILINPFTLTLSVRDASSANADGSRFWSFATLRANLSLASLWQRHLVLDELQLTGLDLQINQKDSARYNFSEILDYRQQHFPATPIAPEPTTDAPQIFPISIHQIVFSAAHIGVNTPYAGEPLTLDINDTHLAFADFSTVPESKTTPPKSITIHSGKGDIALKKIAIKFLRAQEPFATVYENIDFNLAAIATNSTEDEPLSVTLADVSGGQLGVKAAISLGAKRSSGSVTLRNLDLVPAWRYLSPQLAFTAQRAKLDGDIQFTVNWNETVNYALHNSRVLLHDVQLQAKEDADTNVALASLQVEGIELDSTLPSVQIAHIALHEPVLKGWNRDTRVSLLDMFRMPPKEQNEAETPWQILVAAIDSDGGAIHWRASQLGDLPLLIAPLSAHVSNLHWPDAAPLQLQFNTDINNDTKLAVQGELVPADVTGKLNADISGLPIAWANPLLAQSMHATLHSGVLNTHTELTLEKSALIGAHSEGTIEQFELQRQPDNLKLLAWKQLQWQQLAFDFRNNQLQLRRVAVDQPWAQFRINADGTNNFQQLLIQQKSAQPAAANNSANKAADKPAAKPLRLAIDAVHVDKAVLDFRDNSLTRAFRTNIGDFTGDITGLSNRGKDRAKVAMKGSVDGYAPVALSGTVNPFTTPAAMDIALDITNLDLAALTPYSGTYAGYQIDSGRLSVQLIYTLEDNRIKGTNHIVINQMQLGKQVSGPKVMDLPLRFAMYLLTDSDGVMDLGVDVAGNIDDPDFSVSGIIWKALRNLIVKTATSPFRALANLAGGLHQDDLDRVEFGPGSDQVGGEQSDKLRTLTTALAKKPALKLGITGHVSPSHDLEALRDRDLSAELIKQGGINATDIQQQSKNWQREVTALFRKRYPERKAETLAPMQMNDAMRDNLELPSGALQELASRRALAVKQTLVTDLGLAPERTIINAVDLGADKNPGVLATFEVQ